MTKNLTLELETLAREVGAHVRTLPRTSGFRTLVDVMSAFRTLDAPLQARMQARLQGLRPAAAFVEELDGALVPVAGEAWILDPLDGAIQYLHGMPDWCVSITLLRDSVPVVAVLYSPELDELYSAALGEGATRNGVPIRPSAKTELAAAYVATTQPPFVNRLPVEAELSARSLGAVLPVVGAVRSFGATSWQVADVAGGRIDAFWEYGADDVNLLGATLIASEAGATVTDVTGTPWRAGATSIVVATPALHQGLLDVLPARP